MPENKYFLHQVKRTNGEFNKGIVVKDTLEGAKQSYHAYLGAYAYGQDPNTDFVQCFISDMTGDISMPETWAKQAESEEVAGE